MSTPFRSTSPGPQSIGIAETRAKGARNVGLIWILIASTCGALLGVLVVWSQSSAVLWQDSNTVVAIRRSRRQAAPNHRPDRLPETGLNVGLSLGLTGSARLEKGQERSLESLAIGGRQTVRK